MTAPERARSFRAKAETGGIDRLQFGISFLSGL